VADFPAGKKKGNCHYFPRKSIDRVNVKPKRWYYGWAIVAVSFLTLFFSLGTRFSFGVFYVAILKEYAWGRGETAGAFSLALVIHAFFGIITGKLIDRFGPRMFFPLGATFLAMGFATASRITAIWHLYLFFGVIMAVGSNTLSYSPHMSLIPKWFIKKRGLACGLVVSGIGLGTMVMAPFIQLIIDSMGWRSAFLILAGMVMAVVVPMTALFQRRSPEDVGQFPDGIVPESGETHAPQSEGFPKDTRSSHLSEQWTLKAAIYTKAFWWMALLNFCVGFSTNMLVVHQAAHVVDTGYSQSLAALLVGLVGLFRSAGGVLGGFISDRVGREIGYTLGGGFAFVGMVLFLLVRDTASPWILYAFVILFGLGHGSIGPTQAAATGDLFPGNSLGLIMGTFSMGWGLGGALGAYLGGYFYDQVGNYTLPFLLVLVNISLGLLGIWMAAPRQRRTSSPSKAG
jgi:MFS family permease